MYLPEFRCVRMMLIFSVHETWRTLVEFVYYRVAVENAHLYNAYGWSFNNVLQVPIIVFARRYSRPINCCQ